VAYIHAIEYGGLLLICGIIHLLGAMAGWWRDVIREATFEGSHTRKVQESTRSAFVLFIVSEVVFFASLFWALFYSAITPSIYIGHQWPPVGIVTFDYLGIPLVNTILLLLSGVCVTYTHSSLIQGNAPKTIFGFCETLMYAVVFTIFQCNEYLTATFTIADGIYGSLFYLITGFHGFHVIIGTIFLFVCLCRTLLGHFTKTHHLGFEFAVWYWHFVDVVWIFVYVFIYVWSAEIGGEISARHSSTNGISTFICFQAILKFIFGTTSYNVFGELVYWMYFWMYFWAI
jgi:heme/copper-type cytochrome/quinol oxidase subunit 3